MKFGGIVVGPDDASAVWDRYDELGDHLEPATKTTWAEAEQRFPGSSIAWDRYFGADWLAGRPNVTIVIVGDSLAIGCNDHEPYGWAFWLPAQERWILT